MKKVDKQHERVDFPLRLPRWLKDAIDQIVSVMPGETRATLTEAALKKTLKLKQPK